jgi:hypothetical protein
MAKDESTIEAPEDHVALDIALDDWCEGKSRALGRRVEALSAFFKLCQKQGVGRATPEKFEADFQDFLNSPA